MRAWIDNLGMHCFEAMIRIITQEDMFIEPTYDDQHPSFSSAERIPFSKFLLEPMAT
jgi:hypothetical protein